MTLYKVPPQVKLILTFGLTIVLSRALVEAEDVCAASSGQLYFQSQDCRNYIQCINGRSTQFTCPSSTIWNQAASKCDDPKNVTNCRLDIKSTEVTAAVAPIKPAEMNLDSEGGSETADGDDSSAEGAPNGDEAAEDTTAVNGEIKHDEDGKEFLPALIGGLIRAGSAIGKAASKGAKVANKVNKANNAANNANCVRKNGVRNCARRSEAESAEAKAMEGVPSEVASDSSISK